MLGPKVPVAEIFKRLLGNWGVRSSWQRRLTASKSFKQSRRTSCSTCVPFFLNGYWRPWDIQLEGFEESPLLEDTPSSGDAWLSPGLPMECAEIVWPIRALAFFHLHTLRSGNDWKVDTTISIHFGMELNFPISSACWTHTTSTARVTDLVPQDLKTSSND